jgi:hypothetical protein
MTQTLAKTRRIKLLEVIRLLRQERTCHVLPAQGQPLLPKNLSLPEDLRECYQLCGGAYLYETKDYGIQIVEPREFGRANPVIAGVDGADDVSFNWFIIGQAPELGQYISIDLSPTRKGWCYDSFRETHGLAGHMPVVAHSFTDLLERLLENKGNRWYWLEEDFVKLGDAYD